jgi:hypothetical protein
MQIDYNSIYGYMASTNPRNEPRDDWTLNAKTSINCHAKFVSPRRHASSDLHDFASWTWCLGAFGIRNVLQPNIMRMDLCLHVDYMVSSIN